MNAESARSPRRYRTPSARKLMVVSPRNADHGFPGLDQVPRHLADKEFAGTGDVDRNKGRLSGDSPVGWQGFRIEEVGVVKRHHNRADGVQQTMIEHVGQELLATKIPIKVLGRTTRK